MELAECCDIYCTSCKIWYLKFLRPGDTVPFRKPKHILPLGVAEIMIACVVIVLNTLALFCQNMEFTAPAPSFLGSPGFPLWISTLFIVGGCTNVSCYKKKTRFSTAIAFGVSIITTVLSVTLLSVMTMAIAQELTYYHDSLNASGVVISCVICTLTLVQLVVASSSALLCYLSLTSHDDRWFTDRGTQYDAAATSCDNNSNAKLSVPSGQPAFLFYAPSNDASKYTSVFRDVMKGVEKHAGLKSHPTIDEDYDEETDGRKTADFSDGTTIDNLESTEPPTSKQAPDNYLTTPANI